MPAGSMQQRYEPGTTVLGRYVVERRLGEGGMGTVYLARHVELARKRFAIKALRPEVFGHEEVEQRFRREAEVLGALNHPGIVSITDFGMDGATPVMIMEFLEGETLRDRILRKGPLSLAETVRVVREVASALDYTHGFDPPVVHRDLKPENLFLLEPDGRVKVLDFGIAKVTGMGKGITQANTTMGTPQYMSPEQLKDASRVDQATDVFALASVAYECLAGDVAFPGEGLGGVVLAIFDKERPRISQKRDDVPPAVDAVLHRAWSVEPEARPASAGALAALLAEAANVSQRSTAEPGMTAGLPPTRQHALAGVRPPRTDALSPVVLGAGAGAGASSDVGELPTRMERPVGAPPGMSLEPTIPPVTPHVSGPSRWVVPVVVALALTGAAAFAMVKLMQPAPTPTPPTPQVVTPNTTVPTPGEPVLQPGTRPPPEPVVSNNPTVPVVARDAGPRVPPPDAFEVVHREITPRVRRCLLDNGFRGAQTTINVTWDRTGVVSGLRMDRQIAPAARTCVGREMAQYGRVPPQQANVTRPLAFVVSGDGGAQ